MLFLLIVPSLPATQSCAMQTLFISIVGTMLVFSFEVHYPASIVQFIHKTVLKLKNLTAFIISRVLVIMPRKLRI